MRTLDFAPLSRSTIGFDGECSDPPYNIEKLGDDSYRIAMAVASFAEGDRSIAQQANSLLVAGRKDGEETAEYLHHGVTTHAFDRRIDLADFIKVTGACLVDGLLVIDLVREVPEAMKPRSVKIENGPQASLKQVGSDRKGKVA